MLLPALTALLALVWPLSILLENIVSMVADGVRRPKSEVEPLARLLLLPLTAGLMAGSVLSGQVIARTGRYKRFPVVGAVLLVVALIFRALPRFAACTAPLGRASPNVPGTSGEQRDHEEHHEAQHEDREVTAVTPAQRSGRTVGTDRSHVVSLLRVSSSRVHNQGRHAQTRTCATTAIPP